MKMRFHALTTALILGVSAVACGGDDDDDSPADCGTPIDGVSCEDDNGECTAQICEDGEWVCPVGTSEVALTAEGCQGNGGAGGSAGTGG